MNLLELSTLISDEVEADEGLAREDFDIKNELIEEMFEHLSRSASLWTEDSAREVFKKSLEKIREEKSEGRRFSVAEIVKETAAGVLIKNFGEKEPEMTNEESRELYEEALKELSSSPEKEKMSEVKPEVPKETSRWKLGVINRKQETSEKKTETKEKISSSMAEVMEIGSEKNAFEKFSKQVHKTVSDYQEKEKSGRRRVTSPIKGRVRALTSSPVEKNTEETLNEIFDWEKALRSSGYSHYTPEQKKAFLSKQIQDSLGKRTISKKLSAALERVVAEVPQKETSQPPPTLTSDASLVNDEVARVPQKETAQPLTLTPDASLMNEESTQKVEERYIEKMPPSLDVKEEDIEDLFKVPEESTSLADTSSLRKEPSDLELLLEDADKEAAEEKKQAQDKPIEEADKVVVEEKKLAETQDKPVEEKNIKEVEKVQENKKEEKDVFDHFKEKVDNAIKNYEKEEMSGRRRFTTPVKTGLRKLIGSKVDQTTKETIDNIRELGKDIKYSSKHEARSPEVKKIFFSHGIEQMLKKGGISKKLSASLREAISEKPLNYKNSFTRVTGKTIAPGRRQTMVEKLRETREKGVQKVESEVKKRAGTVHEKIHLFAEGIKKNITKEKTQEADSKNTEKSYTSVLFEKEKNEIIDVEKNRIDNSVAKQEDRLRKAIAEKAADLEGKEDPDLADIAELEGLERAFREINELRQEIKHSPVMSVAEKEMLLTYADKKLSDLPSRLNNSSFYEGNDKSPTHKKEFMEKLNKKIDQSEQDTETFTKGMTDSTPKLGGGS